MKKILATIATVLVALVGMPETAEARSCDVGHSYTYVSGRSSCGCPVYTRRVVAGYDRYHRPQYRYYRQPVTHRCRSHYRSPYYRGHSTHRHHSHHRSHPSRSHRSHRSVVIRGRHGSVRICR